MQSDHTTSALQIIIFGRYPVPGNTKTRLIPAVGAVGAAEIQRILTEHLVTIVKKVVTENNIEASFWFEGGDITGMKNWLGNGITFYPQTNGTLGTRMYLAFQHAFEKGKKKVLLLGTDIPDINSNYLIQAFDALNTHDIVLGPSFDGGYCLIGLTRKVNVFDNIPWSTPEVLVQTKLLAKSLGLDLALLNPVMDIDTIDDLKKRRPVLAKKKPYATVIIPALNEADYIESTIESAKDSNVEIIVVDGGSTDSTMAKAEKACVKVVQRPPGRALQQNDGALLAKGKILLFLHADTILPKNYINDVFYAMMNPNIIIGAFRFKTDHYGLLMKTTEYLTNLRAGYLKLPYGDQCLFMRKTTFDDMGGFPDMAIAEDLFFVRQILKYGQLKIVPGEVITSARRWLSVGLIRTFLINQIIVLGCYLGVPASTLATLYKSSRRDR